MSDFRPLFASSGACMCLAFTGSAVAWAESAPTESPRAAQYVEDPYAPHDTTGTTARLGTAVGFIYGERVDVLAVGATTAVGQRWGRFALEAEYSYLAFQVKGPDSTPLGHGQRLGLIGRVDVLRFGSRTMGQNTMLAIYVEGGAGVAWNKWYLPAYDEPMRVVPADTNRVEGQMGLGFQLDHRLQEPIGFPRRIGWFLGWRMALAPHDTEPASVCRGASCVAAPMMKHERFTDRSMLFQSSLAVTW